MTTLQILFVEPDMEAAKAYRAHFCSPKYDSKVIPDGKECLEIFQSLYRNNFQAVVIDSRVPGIEARELVSKLRTLNAELAIFVTADDASLPSNAGIEEKYLLKKPFQMADLESLIAECTNSRPTRAHAMPRRDNMDDPSAMMLSKPGEHNMIIYGSPETLLQNISGYCSELLGSGNIVMLLPFYQTIDSTREHLKKAGIDVSRYEQSGSLVLLDAARYLGIRQNPIDGFYRLVRQAEKEGRESVTIFADAAGFFLFSDDLGRLLHHENAIPKKSFLRWRIFCCYRESDLVRFTPEEIEKAGSLHQRRIMIQDASSAAQ